MQGKIKKTLLKTLIIFYVSQLRIRIEMAFGLLTTKWRILKSPLQVKVDNIGTIFMAISRLHDYCINERVYDDSDFNNAYNRATAPIIPNQYNTPTTNSSTRRQNRIATAATSSGGSGGRCTCGINQNANNVTVTLEERPSLPSDITTATIIGHSMLRQI
jgi:DDE superfamily endonuclease